MQSENWLTLKVKSSFNCYRIMFIYILYTVIDSSTDQQQDLSVQDTDYKSFASYAC